MGKLVNSCPGSSHFHFNIFWVNPPSIISFFMASSKSRTTPCINHNTAAWALALGKELWQVSSPLHSCQRGFLLPQSYVNIPPFPPLWALWRQSWHCCALTFVPLSLAFWRASTREGSDRFINPQAVIKGVTSKSHPTQEPAAGCRAQVQPSLFLFAEQEYILHCVGCDCMCVSVSTQGTLLLKQTHPAQ